jgi:anti-anti-sigma factor
MNDGFHVELDGDRGASLSGELDLSSYEEAERILAPLFAAEDDVTLDVSRLTFMDSSGIRLIIQLRQALPSDRRLILRSATPQVARVADIAGLADLGITIEAASA